LVLCNEQVPFSGENFGFVQWTSAFSGENFGLKIALFCKNGTLGLKNGRFRPEPPYPISALFWFK
jgi:hypothetical protein